MQVAGTRYYIDADDLSEILDEYGIIRKLLIRYVQTYSMQTTYTALANTVFTTEERLGLIKSTRGLIVIRRRAGLEDFAGSAYGAPEAEYWRLIGQLGKFKPVYGC